MFVDVKLVYGRSMLRRMPKRKAVASIGSTPRAVLLHKIPAVAHSVAHFAAKPAQNTPNLCNTLCCKLLICIRRAYYLSDFKTVAFSHSATPPVSVSNSLAQHPNLPSPLCCTSSRKNRHYRRSELPNSNELNTISPLKCGRAERF
jgi:hypothetical protein